MNSMQLHDSPATQEHDPRWLLDQLAALQAEFSDLAYLLDCRGRADGADIAAMSAARVGELYRQCTELLAADSTATPATR